MEQVQFYRSNNFEVHGIYDPRDTEKVIVFEVIDLVQQRVAYMVGELGLAFIGSTRNVITEKSSPENDEKFLSGFLTWGLCSSLNTRH